MRRSARRRAAERTVREQVPLPRGPFAAVTIRAATAAALAHDEAKRPTA
jgi:hypothetical protein